MSIRLQKLLQGEYNRETSPQLKTQKVTGSDAPGFFSFWPLYKGNQLSWLPAAWIPGSFLSFVCELGLWLKW
jgi:hypothetical protein